MSVPFWSAVARGLRGRCPHCGVGRLYRAYLKPVDASAHCGTSLGHIRADDGPAWLSILVVGHLIAPFFPILKYAIGLPLWGVAVVLVVAVTALTLAILPRAKGVFVAILWRQDQPVLP